MFQLYGIDQLKRIRPASMFADTDLEPGCSVTREIIKPDDIYANRADAPGLGVGLQTISIAVLPANYIYCIKTISVLWSTGAANNVNLLVKHSGVNYYVMSNPTLGAGIVLVWTGSIYLAAGDNILCTINVTGAGVNVSLFGLGFRSPYPS